MGAIIGYVTNAIAIKMLFRPLNEIRVWGIRLPFTPGILPRERHKLANNIGSMVERELFTPEILRNRLQSEDVRRALQKSIAAYTETILNTPASMLLSQKTSVHDISDAARLITFVLKNVTKPSSVETISDSLIHVADKAFLSLTNSLVDFLMKDEIHGELEVHGKIFLTNAILKLNVFQRFFISAGQYDKTIREKMPEIIDDLIKQIDALMKDENTKKRLTVFLQKSISTFFESHENIEQRLGESIDRFIEQHKDETLSRLIHLSAEQKEKIDVFISDKILGVADEKIDSLLTSIDVKRMVSERIDALDMIRVEKIVLDVMDNQLKWINVFGAILGGFIGVFQAVFSRLLM
jgi:uncharacterized membrane protein YheB (UPF0754 family)